jgi:hypothetical protein
VSGAPGETITTSTGRGNSRGGVELIKSTPSLIALASGHDILSAVPHQANHLCNCVRQITDWSLDDSLWREKEKHDAGDRFASRLGDGQSVRAPLQPVAGGTCIENDGIGSGGGLVINNDEVRRPTAIEKMDVALE